MPYPLSIAFNTKKEPPTRVLWSDTSRGLNIEAEGMDLGAKHVADCMNVDWLPGGGWQQRGAITSITTDAMSAEITKMILFTTKEDQAYLVAFGSNFARYLSSPGTATSSLFTGLTGPFDACEVNYKLYYCNGTDAVRVWDGTNAVATLTTSWNSDYTTPANGNFPKCKFMAVWHGRAWALHTKEGSDVHGCRVRSSHPLKNGSGEQDWKELDYNDLDLGKDGGNITGCKVAGAGFYIFKNHHVYEVTGWDWDTSGSNLFTFTPLDTKVGAVSSRAIVGHGSDVYFWDARAGACRITENTNTMARDMYVERLMAPIDGLLKLKRIPDSRMNEVAVGVVGDRIHYTVPWDDGSKRTLVFDTLLGTWTIYDIAMSAYEDFRPTVGTAYFVGADTHASHLVALGREDQDRDVFSSSETADIASYVVSPWLHGDDPSSMKNWSCMDIFADCEGSFDVSVAKNWDRDGSSTVSNQTVGSAGPIDHGGVSGMRVPGRPEARSISLRIAAAGPSPFKRYKVYGISAKFELSDRKC